MSSGRRSPSASAKAVLLAGVALIVLWASFAHAQAPARPADPLPAGELYMEADLVVRDETAKTTRATGHVEVRYEGRTLRANELIYDEGRGVMTARGEVAILNADGTSDFADEIALDDEMKAGVALGFSARLQQNVKIASAAAVRRSERYQELRRAIYTPCEICVDDQPKTPTWSVSAEKVIQDKDRQLIIYRNAVVRVFGAPVLFLPVFWHADPEAGRKSGFLAPKMSASNRRGFSYEQPYYLVTGKSSDVTLTPQINTKVNPFLETRIRKRFYSGEVDARIGYTHEADFDGEGREFGNETSRSFILARGAFRLNEAWRWGFTAERTSDDLLFDKYEVGDVYESRGPYVADDRRLISQLYAIRQTSRSYLSGAAMSIQGLRPEDIDRTFPLIAPLIEARWEPEQSVLGGRARLRASAVVLERDQAPASSAGVRIPGLDSRRATGEADWRATWTSSGGLRLSPFANLRLDAYGLDDLPSTALASRSETRALAVIGADLSWPLFRPIRNGVIVLEPLAQLALSPESDQIVVGRTAAGAPIYLDEDSQAFEFDETNLFRANKFPGFDLFEEGARLNVAGRASVFWNDGRRASLLVGRSFRDETNDVFPARTGLRTKSSDWIVAADAQPIDGISFFARARLDSDSFEVRRAEAGANAYTKYGFGYVRYLRDELDLNGAERENLDIGGELYLTKHWGVTAYANRDLVQKAWIIRDLGLVYRDECTRLELIYRREDTIIGRLGPSDSINLRLTLATLGGPIYAD